MNENLELYQHILKDSDMEKYTISKLIDDLKEKDNKIKKIVEDILHQYESFYEEAKKYLLEHQVSLEKNGKMSKMGASMGIEKEVKSDNSDSSIAEMLIQGLAMGSLDMEKKIGNYEKEVDKKQLKFAKDFWKFQESSIQKLKKFL